MKNPTEINSNPDNLKRFIYPKTDNYFFPKYSFLQAQMIRVYIYYQGIKIMNQYVQIKIARCFIHIFKLQQGARRSCNCIATSSYILQFCLIFKFPKCAFKANFESSKIFEMVEPFREEPTQRSKVTVTNIYLKLGQVRQFIRPGFLDFQYFLIHRLLKGENN